MASKEEKFYKLLLNSAKYYVEDERNFITNLANIAALIYHELNDEIKQGSVNWAGFYLLDANKEEKELFLGPFSGKPACKRIKFGKGVCGTSAETKQSLLVDDVHHFPGHIACDDRSNSELVIPIFNPKNREQVIGVLDLDCLVVNGFNALDQEKLQEIVQLLSVSCDWPY